MSRFEITPDGRLVPLTAGFMEDDPHPDPASHWTATFTGTVDFYTGNSTGRRGDISYTRKGEDAEWVEYRATFVGGRLVEIVEAERTRRPALAESDRPPGPPPLTQDEIAAMEAREAESLVGRTMFHTWGTLGGYEGEMVEIVAEGEKEWVGKQPDGRFVVVDRRFRGGSLWDSAEDAEAAHQGRVAEYEAERARYEALTKEIK